MKENEFMDYAKKLEAELDNQKMKTMLLEKERNEQSAFADRKEAGTIIYQLDFSEELDKLYHLLRGDVMINEKWQENTDYRMKIYTDLGIKEIMNKLHPYLSKHITLGYYEEDQINEKMLIFTRSLINFVMNRYQDFFLYPKASEMYNNIKEIINENPKGYEDINDNELYEKCKEWSKRELQTKLNHFKVTIIFIKDLVHASYIRALKGQTHKGITRSYYVSENNSNPQLASMPIKKRSIWGK